MMFAVLIIQDISDIMSVNDVLILCKTAVCGSSVIMSRVRRHHSLLSPNQTERMLLQQYSDQQHSCVNLNTLLDLAVFSCKLFLQIHEETCRHMLCNNHCWSLSFPRMQVLQNPALLINLLFSYIIFLTWVLTAGAGPSWSPPVTVTTWLCSSSWSLTSSISTRHLSWISLRSDVSVSDMYPLLFPLPWLLPELLRSRHRAPELVDTAPDLRVRFPFSLYRSLHQPVTWNRMKKILNFQIFQTSVNIKMCSHFKQRSWDFCLFDQFLVWGICWITSELMLRLGWHYWSHVRLCRCYSPATTVSCLLGQVTTMLRSLSGESPCSCSNCRLLPPSPVVDTSNTALNSLYVVGSFYFFFSIGKLLKLIIKFMIYFPSTLKLLNKAERIENWNMFTWIFLRDILR